MVPNGQTISEHESYLDAQRTVDALVHGSFPARRIAIVGSDLRSVEYVTAARSYGRAALSGSLLGGWLGIILGLTVVLVAPEMATLATLAASALIGAGFGMLFRIVTHSVTRRRRSYVSVTSVVAARYAVIVPAEDAFRARNILGRDQD